MSNKILKFKNLTIKLEVYLKITTSKILNNKIKNY